MIVRCLAGLGARVTWQQDKVRREDEDAAKRGQDPSRRCRLLGQESIGKNEFEKEFLRVPNVAVRWMDSCG
jgi:hypothetical protein